MANTLTRENIRRRSVRIRITGQGDLPQLVAAELANQVACVARRVIDWSGNCPTEADPEVNHVYLTLVPDGGIDGIPSEK